MPPALRRFVSVGAGAFVLSLILSYLSNELLQRVNIALAAILLLAVIALGVLFDMLGVAAASAREGPFHAMAVDRVPGAAEAILLVRNAHHVSSFSQDVVGDVAGTLSGAIATTIVFALVRVHPEWAAAPLTPGLVAVAAALTIGGKAAEKEFALQHWDRILLQAGRAVLLWTLLKRAVTGRRASVESDGRRKGRSGRASRQSRRQRK
ncbi:hypothetical protein [Limnochorda pilosa]|uniref:Uncharacterized protein n=1 Tax=Limnochorda pilosa TaxID=1555112 RepID=A0A0K2SMT3_LIMPI|nr:hypothetical protein [Limnochorda pilosa]BAS28420.1 hypothetical protein LIP_2590 [Limnochorda pilosa]